MESELFLFELASGPEPECKSMRTSKIKNPKNWITWSLLTPCRFDVEG
jgi:hypothetical protein